MKIKNTLQKWLTLILFQIGIHASDMPPAPAPSVPAVLSQQEPLLKRKKVPIKGILCKNATKKYKHIMSICRKVKNFLRYFQIETDVAIFDREAIYNEFARIFDMDNSAEYTKIVNLDCYNLIVLMLTLTELVKEDLTDDNIQANAQNIATVCSNVMLECEKSDRSSDCMMMLAFSPDHQEKIVKLKKK